jgi:hypothetical protein
MTVETPCPRCNGVGKYLDGSAWITCAACPGHRSAEALVERRRAREGNSKHFLDMMIEAEIKRIYPDLQEKLRRYILYGEGFELKPRQEDKEA